jgi:guanylate kinase
MLSCMERANQPTAVVLIGPSGSGKSTLASALAYLGTVSVTPTFTTRAPRADEQSRSRDHRFVTEEEFSRLEANGAFLLTAQLPGLPQRYGLARGDQLGASAQGKHLPRGWVRHGLPVPPALGPPRLVRAPRRPALIIARAAAVPSIARVIPNLCVYQLTAPAEVARRRLIERGCSLGELEARLAAHDDETRAGAALADRVFVNDGSPERLVYAMHAAICADLQVVDQLALLRASRRHRRLERAAWVAWLTCLAVPPLWPVALLWGWSMLRKWDNK